MINRLGVKPHIICYILSHILSVTLFVFYIEFVIKSLQLERNKELVLELLSVIPTKFQVLKKKFCPQFRLRYVTLNINRRRGYAIKLVLVFKKMTRVCLRKLFLIRFYILVIGSTLYLYSYVTPKAYEFSLAADPASFHLI